MSAHLSHEDPDQPEAACEDREGDVDEQVDDSVLLHCSTPWSWFRVIIHLVIPARRRKPLAPVKGPRALLHHSWDEFGELADVIQFLLDFIGGHTSI